MHVQNISKDNVYNKFTNTKNVIEEKTNKNVVELIQSKNDNKQEELSKDKIFYLIGDTYYIEGVKIYSTRRLCISTSWSRNLL